MGGMGQDMVTSLDSLTGTTFIRRFTCAAAAGRRVRSFDLRSFDRSVVDSLVDSLVVVVAVVVVVEFC